MQIVPQFIDTEDKVAGPFTWKQLAWLALGGFILFILWRTLDMAGFIVFALPVIAITGAFTFYRPNGMTFAQYVYFGIAYFFKPHIFTWQREVQKDTPPPKNKESASERITRKALTEDDILTLTEAIDSRGAVQNERLQELIKQNLQRSGVKGRRN